MCILLYMSKFVIYIPLPKYLSEWLVFRLGTPVVFPNQSPQNSIIRTFITKLPPGKAPDMDVDGMTAIAIPDSVAKPPEVYNYMGERGKKAVAETIKDLFVRQLWNDISPLNNSSVNLNKLIYAWCEMNGIGIDRVDSVRQCYLRIRKSYSDRGIDLRSHTRKKS